MKKRKQPQYPPAGLIQNNPYISLGQPSRDPLDVSRTVLTKVRKRITANPHIKEVIRGAKETYEQMFPKSLESKAMADIMQEKTRGNWEIVRRNDSTGSYTELYEKVKRKSIKFYRKGPRKIYVKYRSRVLYFETEEEAYEKIKNLMAKINARREVG